MIYLRYGINGNTVSVSLEGNTHLASIGPTWNDARPDERRSRLTEIVYESTLSIINPASPNESAQWVIKELPKYSFAQLVVLAKECDMDPELLTKVNAAYKDDFTQEVLHKLNRNIFYGKLP